MTHYSEAPPRRRRRNGRQTHSAILDAATRVASVEGINALTIGRLADTLGVSKSGLSSHFGSKEQLQLETIRAAWSIFEREVLQPAFEAPNGIQRLRALCDAYLVYVERGVFPGGCFFASLVGEMDARSGPVHDVAVSMEESIVDGVANLVREAQRRREIKRSVDPLQLAFELQACVELANHLHPLRGSHGAGSRTKGGHRTARTGAHTATWRCCRVTTSAAANARRWAQLGVPVGALIGAFGKEAPNRALE